MPTAHEIVTSLKVNDYEKFKKKLQKTIRNVDEEPYFELKRRAFVKIEQQDLTKDTDKLALVSIAIFLRLKGCFSKESLSALFPDISLNIEDSGASNYFLRDAGMIYFDVKGDLEYPRKPETEEVTLMEQAYNVVTSTATAISETSHSAITGIASFLKPPTKITKDSETQTTDENLHTYFSF